MECSICYDAINAQTGITTMSCTHSFHFHCLVKWFGSQADKDLHESCPCCRHQANEHERLPEESEEESADEGDEYDEDEEDESEWEDFNVERAAANQRAAYLFKGMKDALSEKDFQAYAATRIQTMWRGHAQRKAWYNLKDLAMETKLNQEDMNRLHAEKERLQRLRLFHEQSIKMSRSKWLSLCATKVQAVARGNLARRTLINKALMAGHKINWVFGDAGRWERKILCRKESWVPSDGLPPQSLMFQNHQLWTRVQAAWRAYRIRKMLTTVMCQS